MRLVRNTSKRRERERERAAPYNTVERHVGDYIAIYYIYTVRCTLPEVIGFHTNRKLKKDENQFDDKCCVLHL